MSPVYYMTQINNGTDISEWTWGEFQNQFQNDDPEMQTKLNKKHDEYHCTMVNLVQTSSGHHIFRRWST